MRKIFCSKGYVLALILLAAVVLRAENVTVSGRVELVGKTAKKNPAASAVVVWLTSLSNVPPPKRGDENSSSYPKLVQKNKSFEPHLLVVPVGATVEFPNADPWFHNVFSLFDGKRFDLGLYEAGTSRKVHFDRVGISYIFCNIHSQMSAVVVVLDTPYYGISRGTGILTIPDVPPGRYRLNVWNEAALPEQLKSASRDLTVSESTASLGIIRITQGYSLLLSHKNKYGVEYDNPDPSNPVYTER